MIGVKIIAPAQALRRLGEDVIDARADDSQDNGEGEDIPDVIGILPILLGPPGRIVSSCQNTDDDQDAVPVNGKVRCKLDDDGIKRWSH